MMHPGPALLGLVAAAIVGGAAPTCDYSPLTLADLLDPDPILSTSRHRNRIAQIFPSLARSKNGELFWCQRTVLTSVPLCSITCVTVAILQKELEPFSDLLWFLLMTISPSPHVSCRREPLPCV